MLIVNADDWGRSQAETDAALACYARGRITSVTAMVFMEDSERAAELAKEAGVDVGLHLNLVQEFNGRKPAAGVLESHDRVCRFLKHGKYALLLYNPFLRKQFCSAYLAQAEEFQRLYGRPPSHIDGHQHMHLCANMVLEKIIPGGQKMRRNFSFCRGEKGFVNRTYRSLVDEWLGRRYRLTDYFFGLAECLQTKRLKRVSELARAANVELMTHPVNADEYNWLTSDRYYDALGQVQMGT